MNITHLSVLKAFYLPRRRRRTAPQLSGPALESRSGGGRREQRGATANGCFRLSDGSNGEGAGGQGFSQGGVVPGCSLSSSSSSHSHRRGRRASQDARTHTHTHTGHRPFPDVHEYVTCFQHGGRV